jgi:hypothetical protein
MHAHDAPWAQDLRACPGHTRATVVPLLARAAIGMLVPALWAGGGLPAGLPRNTPAGNARAGAGLSRPCRTPDPVHGDQPAGDTTDRRDDRGGRSVRGGHSDLALTDGSTASPTAPCLLDTAPDPRESRPGLLAPLQPIEAVDYPAHRGRTRRSYRRSGEEPRWVTRGGSSALITASADVRGSTNPSTTISAAGRTFSRCTLSRASTKSR